ncbi:MAG TPA: acyl-CoA thioesterase/BAAT N-terminal domain-containing protein, partial [Candidatus Sulfotelmatobacter sp.]|nr:acyl-CoA thioesterase/BAAT N-terminal domain-containing protein [Candidatus Sulfotelmatobacter sp.]
GNVERVTISVDKQTTLISNPVHAVVRGLAAGESATVVLESIDRNGSRWTSSASFETDGNGEIDLARAAPRSGSYSGADAMGLFWSMKPPPTATAPAALEAPYGNELDTLTVRRGNQQVASQSILREYIGPGVQPTYKRTPIDSFYGDYYPPADVSRTRPGLLIFGGSEGGLTGALVAAQLASLGYPALALAYFAEPGLPKTLLNVPLEYFRDALIWLGRQPGVDAGRLIVYGASRGGEAALLLGATYPDVVHGVVALVPSAWVNCSYPGCTGAAWTLDGRPVPFTGEVPDAEALIHVERIKGPLFVDCGRVDAVWLSCPYADEIKRELATGFAYAQKILEFPQAGHGIGSLLPFVSGIETSQLEGTSPSANQVAREQAWPQLLAFLNGIAAS